MNGHAVEPAAAPADLPLAAHVTRLRCGACDKVFGPSAEPAALDAMLADHLSANGGACERAHRESGSPSSVSRAANAALAASVGDRDDARALLQAFQAKLAQEQEEQQA